MSAPASLTMAAALGNMPTTSVRRLISPLSRSMGLVLAICGHAAPAPHQAYHLPTMELHTVTTTPNRGHGELNPCRSLGARSPDGQAVQRQKARTTRNPRGRALCCVLAAFESTDEHA